MIHSRPMTIDEVADYLVVHGWMPASGDPLKSLKKAFAGRLPLVQQPDGKFDLELKSTELG